MLTAMIRRLALTSLIVTSFVGAGMLFGQANTPSSSLNVAEISLDIDRSGSNAGDLTLPVSHPKASAHSSFSWPFFSFKKGGR